jgi:hypothetical protein
LQNACKQRHSVHDDFLNLSRDLLGLLHGCCTVPATVSSCSGRSPRDKEVPRGGGTAYHSDYVGRVVEATDRGIALEVETPQTIGVDRETYELPYERIMHVRLL